MVGSKRTAAENQSPSGALPLPSPGTPCPPGNSLSGESVISGPQRADTVNNMVAAACRLQLSNDVLFLAVACLDRYLAAVPTPVALIQPLSITCIWVAAKYESVTAPAAAVFASLVSNPVNSKVITAVEPVKILVYLEAAMLRVLGYQLSSTQTTKHQLRLMMQRLQASTAAADTLCKEQPQQQEQLYSMMSYLVEVGLMEYQLLSTPASQLAAAAYALAHVLLGRHLDVKLLENSTGYSFPQLQTPLHYLCALHTTLVQALINGKPYAVSVKYSAPELHAVACVAPLCDPKRPKACCRVECSSIKHLESRVAYCRYDCCCMVPSACVIE